MVSFSAHAHLYTHTPRARKMSGSEPIILSDLLFSKIPGSPRRKVRRQCVHFIIESYGIHFPCAEHSSFRGVDSIPAAHF